MTHLRKMMLEELQRRHYSEATTRRYVRFIERFAHRRSGLSSLALWPRVGLSNSSVPSNPEFHSRP